MSCFLGCIEPCTFMLCLFVPIRLPNFRHQTEVACSKWSEPWQISRIQDVCWFLAIGTWHFSQTNLAKDKTIGIGTNKINVFFNVSNKIFGHERTTKFLHPWWDSNHPTCESKWVVNANKWHGTAGRPNIGNNSANIYGLFKCPIKYSSRSCAPFGFVVQSPSVIDLKVVNNFRKLVDDAERIQKVIEERSQSPRTQIYRHLTTWSLVTWSQLLSQFPQRMIQLWPTAPLSAIVRWRKWSCRWRTWTSEPNGTSHPLP